MSYFRTAILLAAMTALFMGIGFLIGGQSGMVIALARRRGDEPLRLLELRQDGAVHVRRARGRRALGARAYALVRQLAAAAGLPMPRVYVMENPQPNAFATGPQSRACRRRGHDRPAQHREPARSWPACWRMSSATSSIATRC